MDSKLTLQKIAEECQHIVNLKLYITRVEVKDNSQVHRVQPSKRKTTNVFQLLIEQVLRRGLSSFFSLLIFVMVVEVSILKVIVFWGGSTKTCYELGRLGHKSTCCRYKKWRKNNKKPKREINKTSEKGKFVFLQINDLKMEF